MVKAKKILSVVTATALVLSVSLTGCNKSTSSTTSGSGSSSQAKEPVTITFWCAGDTQSGLDRINNAVNKHLEEKGEYVRLNFQLMGWGDTMEQKVTTMLTSGGSDADLIFTCNWLNNYRGNANSGYFEDLTKYLETDEGKEIVEILGQDFLDGSKIKGKNYALPINKEKAHDWGFLIRTDLAKQYGLTDFSTIKSTKDLVPYFDKVLKDNKGITPLCVAAFDAPWHFLDWDMVGDDDVPLAISYKDGGNGKVIDPFIDPDSIALYKEMKEYYDKGYVKKDATTADGIDAELKKGTYFCGCESLKPGKDKEMTNSTGYDYTQVDITEPVKSNRETTGSMIAINKFSKHKDDAFHMLYLLYTDETVINLLTFGEEGTDYKKESDGRITTQKSDYVFGNGWMIGNQFKDLLMSTEDPDKWNQFEKFNDGAKALPSLGFMFDDTNVSSQEVACKNVVDKYYKQLVAGAVDDVDATVSAMSSELKSAGIDDLIKEAQAQYDEFLKNK